MSKPRDEEQGAEMLPEYDFSKGVRGKYARRYAEGSNVVVLAPDVAEEFQTSASVNEALRQVVEQRRASRGMGGREKAV